MQLESGLRRPRGGAALQFTIEAEASEAIALKELFWSSSGAAAALNCHHNCPGGYSPGVPVLFVEVVFQHGVAILLELIPQVATTHMGPLH